MEVTIQALHVHGFQWAGMADMHTESLSVPRFDVRSGEADGHPGFQERLSLSPLDIDALAGLLASKMRQNFPAVPQQVSPPAPQPAAEVDLLEHWRAHLRPHQDDGKRTLYRQNLIHCLNRSRWCPDCDRVVLVSAGGPERRRKKLELSGEVACPEKGHRTTTPASAARLDRTVLQSLHARLVSDGFSIASATKVLRYVRAVLTDASERGLIAAPPRKVKVPRSQKRIRLWSVTELTAFVEAAMKHARKPDWVPNPGHWWLVYVMSGVLTGMRRGEITSLRWSDVTDSEIPPHDELAANEITHPDGWFTYCPPKQDGMKPDPLTLPRPKVLADAHRLARTFGFDRIVPPTANDDQDYRVYSKWFDLEFPRLRELAGIDRNLTTHDLRRTFETLYGKQFGADEAQAYDGHAERSVSGQSYNDRTQSFCEHVNQFAVCELFQPFVEQAIQEAAA